MMNQPVINKKMIMGNTETKAVWKAAKKHYSRRRRHGQSAKGKPLKGTLLKVVQASPTDHKVIEMNSDVTVAAPIGSVTKESLIESLKSVNLRGMSGNSFPVYQKLEAFAEVESAEQSVLLVNAVECDPGLVHDEWLVKSHFEEIKQGIIAIKHAFGIKRAILAMKAVRREDASISVMFQSEEIEVCRVPARYPAGEEHFLIQSTLGMELPKSELPVRHGILVMNVQTLWQISRLINGTFDGGHYITVADVKRGIAKPAYVYPETKITDLLNKAFGQKNVQEYQCVSGGGIMDSHEVGVEEQCTEKISFAAYLPTAFAAVLSNQNRCKGCGACSHKCPAGIDVRKIVSLREENPNADISLYHPEACLHCGSCTWFCHGNKIPELYVNQ